MAPRAGQGSEGAQRVLDLECHEPVLRPGAAAHDGACGAALRRFPQELMAVEPLALQGDEQRAGLEGPRVGADGAERDRARRVHAEHPGHPRAGPAGHVSPRAASASRTTSPSSKGSRSVPMIW